MERALVVVKPDGMEKAIIGKIITKMEDCGLRVVGVKMVKANEAIVGKHYAPNEEWLLTVGKNSRAGYEKAGKKVKETDMEIGMRIRSMLMKELTRVPIVAIVFEGNAANKIARKLAGATEPKSADPSTLRGMYANDSYELADKEARPIRNIVHVSDSPESADREIKVWFSDSELFKTKQ